MYNYTYVCMYVYEYNHINICKYVYSPLGENKTIYLHNWKITIITQIVARKISVVNFRLKLLIMAISKTAKPVS